MKQSGISSIRQTDFLIDILGRVIVSVQDLRVLPFSMVQEVVDEEVVVDEGIAVLSGISPEYRVFHLISTLQDSASQEQPHPIYKQAPAMEQ